MKLEAVCVSVGYADFLAETLPLNKQHFSNMVVVTTVDDVDTQKICEVNHVKCVQTDAFGIERGEFCKGRGINEGLRVLDLDGWVVHLDADVVLPPLFGRIIGMKKLVPSAVYGCDRYMIPDAKSWYQHKRRPKLQHEDNIWLHTDAYPLGTRIVSTDSNYGGYVPIGFFQLWNPHQSGVLRYPTSHTSAGKTDMLFAGQFKPSDRQFLPEIIVYHLQSDPDAENGANWNGRVTPTFEYHRRWRPCRRWRRWWRRRHDRHHHHHHPEPPPPPPPPYFVGVAENGA